MTVNIDQEEDFEEPMTTRIEPTLPTAAITLASRAEIIAKKRLFLKDSTGTPIEDFPGMCHRVAKFLANSPAEEKRFYDVLINQEFMPNSPCLVNAGVLTRPNQLSGCFVLGVPDTLDGIFDTIKQAAMIHKSGGGTGFSFSKLRPKNTSVASTHGVASGPVSFMKVFNAATEEIKQGGVRRGANMGVLRVDHPDIEDFISVKSDRVSLQNFNLSVAITDRFFHALETNTNYDLIDPNTRETISTSAKAIFEKIVDCAHSGGEPGLLFIDRINQHNPLTGDSNIIEATNPCGEQPLAPDEACGLGSINLAVMVSNGQINFTRLLETVATAVLMLNRMMQKSEYPNDKIKTRVDYSRKIGLGVMGFADLLIKLKIPYSSPDAVEIAENIAVTMLDNAVLATHRLGEVEGVFPAFHEYKMPIHIKEALNRLGIAEADYTPANSAITTIAPTGTISMIAECSASIEPIYKFIQFENRADTVIEHHHLLYAKWKELYPNASLPLYYEEAHDIAPSQHIAIQSIFQKYNCSGVSKTINLPSSATKKDVSDAYFAAYRSGCKGITIYRDGSLENQVLSGSYPSGSGSTEGQVITPAIRPKMLSGKTHQIKTGYGEMLVTINYHNGKPFELICQLGKSGASEMAKAEAISRLCSIMLRCGIAPDIIVGQLEGIVGSSPVHSEYGLILSIPDAISKLITHHVLDNSHAEGTVPAMMKCPDCGKAHGLNKIGSCIKCSLCGWESCGG